MVFVEAELERSSPVSRSAEGYPMFRDVRIWPILIIPGNEPGDVCQQL
jgi:hypothetical protein